VGEAIPGVHPTSTRQGKKAGHPAPPFWAAGSLSPTLIVVDWPHTSLDQIRNKFFLNIKINSSYNNKIATRLSGTVILQGSNLVPTTSMIMLLAATPTGLAWSWIFLILFFL
jgi:hypothetical protein